MCLILIWWLFLSSAFSMFFAVHEFERWKLNVFWKTYFINFHVKATRISNVSMFCYRTHCKTRQRQLRVLLSRMHTGMCISLIIFVGIVSVLIIEREQDRADCSWCADLQYRERFLFVNAVGVSLDKMKGNSKWGPSTSSMANCTRSHRNHRMCLFEKYWSTWARARLCACSGQMMYVLFEREETVLSAPLSPKTLSGSGVGVWVRGGEGWHTLARSTGGGSTQHFWQIHPK